MSKSPRQFVKGDAKKVKETKLLKLSIPNGRQKMGKQEEHKTKVP